MLNALPKAVLFDWDGTLVDSWPIIHESMNQTLKAMGHAEWTIKETNERVRRSLREAFPALFGDRWEEARDIFYSAYRAVHLERVEKKECAEELIEVLFGLGVHLGVVSNKSGDHLRAESRKLGWDRYFEGRLIGATDARRDKPATDPVYMALAGSGISPGSDVWFVGDTWVDIACGRAAKCHTILIGENRPDDPEFADHPPHERISTCRVLMEVVRKF